MNKETLKKTLLNWASFTCVWGVWCYPDGTTIENSPPNFLKSLDACFKWLVPKLIAYDLGNYKGIANHQAIVATNKIRGKSAIAETPALALCLAIEKLITKPAS